MTDPAALLVRYRTLEGGTGVALKTGAGLHPLPALRMDGVLASTEAFGQALLQGMSTPPTVPADSPLLTPIEGLTEVWACGVTYERSRQARVAESDTARDVYERVYDAERPELFFKAASWRVVGPLGAVTVRRDSHVSVPEPEVALVVAGDGGIVGFTICNDMSARDIEGENPLYLPQAKMWLGSTAVGPGLVPAAEIPDPYALAIAMTIERAGEVVFHGEASTAQLHRRYDELVSYLCREDRFPGGAILATGTSIVPGLDFTLGEGDRIIIEVGGIGVLENVVALGSPGAGVLIPSP